MSRIEVQFLIVTATSRDEVMLTAKSAERRRPRQRADFLNHSTEVLLRDHTVLELASQHVPICAPTNINPCTVLPRRLPRLLTGHSPTRLRKPSSLAHRNSRHAALQFADTHGVKGVSTVSDSYQTYHQLQCPVCRAASSTTYLGQNKKTFVAERTSRDALSLGESNARAQCFKAFMIGIAAIEKASCGPMVVAAPITSLPRDQYEELSAWETGERLELAKVLWRQLRSLQFSADALLKVYSAAMDDSNFNNPPPHDRGARPAPSQSLVKKLQSTVNQVDAAMVTLAPLQASLKSVHRSECKALKSDERDQRLCIESEYTSVMAVIEVSASAWRASASKSLEQRRLQEQAQEQQRQLALESKTREFLVKDELVAWTSIISLVREHTGAFRLQLILQAMTAMFLKEEKIRADRCAACTAERDSMFHRAVLGLEEGARRDHVDAAQSSQVELLHDHSDWVAARSPEDLHECRAWRSKATVEAAVDGAVSLSTEQQR
jgi:hypothetical protein